jgi:predicted PurR-regulated permease PerM
MTSSSRGRRFSAWVKFGLPLLVLTLLWVFYHEAPLLFTSLMISWGFFYLLSPVVDYLEARSSIRRSAASAIVLVGAVLVSYLIWWSVFKMHSQQWSNIDLDEFQNNFRGRVQKMVNWAEAKKDVFQKNKKTGHPSLGLPSVSTTPGAHVTTESTGKSSRSPTPAPNEHALSDKLTAFAQNEVVHWIPDIAFKIASFLPSLILVPYFTFFFLKDGRSFKKTVIQWIPNRYFEPALKFFYEMDQKMQSYLLCALLDCLLVGLLVGIGSALIGAPNPVLFGLIAFALNSIPLLGPLLYGAICLVLLLGSTVTDDTIFAFIGVFILSRVCDDLIFIPTIYGRSHHLHPVAVVCAVLLGERLAGVWGMFLAIPVVSIFLLAMSIAREIALGEEARRLPESVNKPFA